MCPEPKILPWLARKSGVSLPVARATWRDIARETITQYGDRHLEGEIVNWQICELRRRLQEMGARARQETPGLETELDWMFPYPLFQALAACQARIVLQAWVTWAKATRAMSQWRWQWAPAGR